MTSVQQTKKALTIVANRATTEKQLAEKLATWIDILAVEPLADNVWKIICPKETQLNANIRQVCYQQAWDFALQDETPCEKKLLMSDMDATIVVGETIDDMAKVLGLYDEISTITEAAMQGKLDYRAALKQRLALLKGIPRSVIMDIAENAPITNGADRLLAAINQRGMDSCLISGGFSTFTEMVSKKLGFKRHLSNLLSYDAEDKLDGHWVGDLVTADVKKATLKTLVQQNAIELCETVAIGDGANDIKMVSEAGLGVAFYGKPPIREIAQAEIHSGSIDNLLWFL